MVELDGLLGDLTSLDPGLRGRAADRLRELDRAELLAALLVRLGDRERPCLHRAVLGLRALCPVGGAPSSRVAEALADTDWRLREEARSALEQGPGLVATLTGQLLEGEQPWARQVAAEALHGLPADEVLPPLAVALVDDPDHTVRAAAAGVLGALGDPRAVPVLAAALSDPEGLVRATAGTALAALGEPACEALGRALSGGDPDVRRRAAEALGGIGGARATALLTRALDDVDDTVKQAAALGLGKCGAAEAIVPLCTAMATGTRRVREAAVRGLADLGEPAADALVEALSHSSLRVRRRAAEALGRLGCTRAAPGLLATLAEAERQEDLATCQAAANALERLGPEGSAAVPTLRRLARRHGDASLGNACRRAIAGIEAAVVTAPTELVGSAPPEGLGTELEAVEPPLDAPPAHPGRRRWPFGADRR